MQRFPLSAPRRAFALLGLAGCLGAAAAVVRAAEAAEGEAGWIPLFNGRDLTGWKAKFTGCPLGDNYRDTFRVRDGVLQVAYDRYERFDGRFGHLFYEQPFSHYRLRAEYRFVGEQTPGGPGWAWRNSGLMLHCQAPESLRVDQEFPVSIEVQLLGGDGRAERSTANLCTPGTHVVLGGRLHTPHCTNSRSKTFHGDQWVTVEVEVRGDERIRHFVNGELVLEYTRPQLDPDDADARRLRTARGGELRLREGYIALQAESHPVEFRKVELLPLAP